MYFNEEIKSGMWNENGGIYLCTCGTESLVFEFSEDEEFLEDDFCTVSIWSLYGDNFSWSYRLRSIWNIIRYGHPYTDTVCLNKSQTEKICKLLDKQLKTRRKNEKSVKGNDKN